MATTDLSEIVRARLAAKAEQGLKPNQADLAWLDATREHATPSSSVEISRNAKGEMQFTVKAAHLDAYVAAENAKVLANHLRAVYPMGNGTVGAPMEELPTPKAPL
jgi:hypothetical protein